MIFYKITTGRRQQKLMGSARSGNKLAGPSRLLQHISQIQAQVPRISRTSMLAEHVAWWSVHHIPEMPSGGETFQEQVEVRHTTQDKHSVRQIRNGAVAMPCG